MKLFKAEKFDLQYSTWGNPKGKPALFFHGFPGSHVQAEAISPLVDKYNLFLVACDRPGYGGSLGRGKPKDFLRATKQLMENLQCEKFHILGVSGGAPWAHMMASEFPDSTLNLALISGLCSFNKETKQYFTKFQRNGLQIAKFLPHRAKRKILNIAMNNFNPERGLAYLLKTLNEADQAILRDPRTHDLIANSMQHARKQGPEGILFDTNVYARDWLKEFCDIEKLMKVSTTYFHGKQDHILEFPMSEWMSKKIPGSKLKYFETHGHYSLSLNGADQILSVLFQ